MPRRRPDFWMTLLILIGACFAVLTCWALQSAQVPGRAVAAGRSAGGAQFSGEAEWQKRGWVVHFSQTGREFRAQVLTAGGEALRGVTAHLELTDQSPPLDLRLDEQSPGLYAVQLPAGIDGRHAARARLEHDGFSLLRAIRLELPHR